MKLLGPTVTRPLQDTLAVLLLDNQLHIPFYTTPILGVKETSFRVCFESEIFHFVFFIAKDEKILFYFLLQNCCNFSDLKCNPLFIQLICPLLRVRWVQAPNLE